MLGTSVFEHYIYNTGTDTHIRLQFTCSLEVPPDMSTANVVIRAYTQSSTHDTAHMYTQTHQFDLTAQT